MPDQPMIVWPIVRVRCHRSARYPAGTLMTPLTAMKLDRSSPTWRSLRWKPPFSTGALSWVTTPLTMFWSSWSIMITSPSTHIGQRETFRRGGRGRGRGGRLGRLLARGGLALDVGHQRSL